MKPDPSLLSQIKALQEAIAILNARLAKLEAIILGEK